MLKKRTNIKFFIDTQGDPSVGIMPSMATVVIKDDFSYAKQEELEELKQRISILYEDQGAVIVKTELEFLRESLKLQIESKEYATNALNEFTGFGSRNVEEKVRLQNAVRIANQNVGNVKRKITLLTQEYNEMNVWH